MDKIEDRTYQFSLGIVKLVQKLPKNNVCEVLGRQVLRSGTSIGANVEEAVGSISKKDFTYRMSIALREARETNYWLRIIRDSKLLDNQRLEPLLQESYELKLILSKTVSSSKLGDKKNI